MAEWHAIQLVFPEFNKRFLERNKALSDLSEEEDSVWWSVLMISTQIILVETAPIDSKLIMPPGPYDIALAREELLRCRRRERDPAKQRSGVSKTEGVLQQAKADVG